MGFRPIPHHFPILPSAARTVDTTSGIFVNNEGFAGVRIFIDVTASAETPSVEFIVQIWDPIGGDWADLLTSAAQTGSISTPVVMTIGPGVASVSNVSLSNYIGQRFRVFVDHSDADSITYSVAGEWLGPC